jgi:hypothetical protein
LESATIAEAHDPERAAFLGGLLLTGIFIKALIDYNKVENTYAGKFLEGAVRGEASVMAE